MDVLNKLFVVRLELLPFLVGVLLIAFTVHEYAHAFFAWKFGDSTAKSLGRVSLNPLKHVDFIGFFLFLIIGIGWAKPVPVNRDHFKHPRRMGIIVSAAGPISNLLLAFFGVFLWHLCLKYGILNLESAARWQVAIYYSLHFLIKYNLLLFLFNLLPLPPLDGYRILEDSVPHRFRIHLQAFEKWSIFIFLLLAFFPPLRHVMIQPLFGLIGPIWEQFSWAVLFLIGR